MKNLVFFIVFLLFSGCSYNHDVSFALFEPNADISVKDVYALNLPRVQGIDVEEYQKLNNDTIIVFSISSKMVCSQRWYVPISENTDMYDLKKYLKEKYNVITLKYDTIKVRNEVLGVEATAVNLKNNLKFSYSVIEEANDSNSVKRYVMIIYTYPKFNKYLKQKIDNQKW